MFFITNFDLFIHNAKKKREKNLIICLIMFITFALFSYFFTHDFFIPIGILIMGTIAFLIYLYNIHKINSSKNKLTTEEKRTFEKELSL